MSETVETQAAEIVAANRYMVLSTADADGRPWVSPVWFATDDGVEFLWLSRPDTRHSANVRARPEMAIVIFDSTVAPGDAKALYVSARADELDGAERDRCLEIYSRASVAQGLTAFTPNDVGEGGRWRLYRAVATERSVLGPGDERLPLG
jgi:nitroimidazol reductase NimA-like FMN-containing flavoprotein (pyridoxamine 5'-phosphate oxidase superfamily)